MFKHLKLLALSTVIASTSALASSYVQPINGEPLVIPLWDKNSYPHGVPTVYQYNIDENPDWCGTPYPGKLPTLKGLNKFVQNDTTLSVNHLSKHMNAKQLYASPQLTSFVM
ncbi:hypothetical protein ACP3V5_17475 [Vibrio maritimus]